MKRIMPILAIFLLSLSPAGSALSQGGGNHSDHGARAKEAPPAQGSNHEGMQMETGGAMSMLGTAATDGIKAMAHLQDLHQGEAQHSAAATHNFMVAFEAEDKGSAITQGRAAVKVTSPDGQTGSAVTLNPKAGFFNADLALKTPGRYTFLVGTKLADDKPRQFSFSYELK
ncbi:MAG: hypothetical protein C4519_01035 [Desulfobacteraceae bacterium]|nr:MAG: hypothetical protein C4519_01035 [Desulfobacteraceae bacterium]